MVITAPTMRRMPCPIWSGFWRGDRTREFRRAYAICQSALDNLATAESARAYVVAAAERAGLLDRRPRIATARLSKLDA